MNQPTTYPPYTDAERQSRETFLALMWALSQPGSVQQIPLVESDDLAAVFARIGDALLDLETSYFSPDGALVARLKHTAARYLPADRAAYHFYPQIDQAALATIEIASVGTYQYPDEAASLFIGCAFDGASEKQVSLRFTGPGVKGSADVQLWGIPPEFWALRQRATAFPLGWDIYLVDPSGKIIGLPRSTRISQE